MGLSFKRTTFSVADTTTEIAAGEAGRRIGVHGGIMSASATGVCHWESATRDISGVINFATNDSVVLPLSQEPYFHTSPGEALQLDVTTITVTGSIVYSVF